jgi:inosine/xanthosine triphosphatase
LRENITVRVGSRNTAKLEAVRRGLAPFFARVDVVASEVESSVHAQPIGFSEIIAGARQRARASHSAGKCDVAAGIEDGLVSLAELPGVWLNFGCCVLFDGGREGYGFTAGFEFPPRHSAAALSPDRTPIGDSFAAAYRAPAGLADPGPEAQAIDRLTGGALTRADRSAQAVTCAWLRFLHPELYAGETA